MIHHVRQLVRHSWLRYIERMAKRNRSDGSDRIDLLGAMAFMEFGGSQLEDELRDANAKAGRRTKLSISPSRGDVLARIINAAATTGNEIELEDLTDLSDEDFIKRMTR